MKLIPTLFKIRLVKLQMDMYSLLQIIALVGDFLYIRTNTPANSRNLLSESGSLLHTYII